ncbi:MAG: SCO family protein [Halobacteriales archaeon]|nr:SCO family protein [Halobacteriales archaeon]
MKRREVLRLFGTATVTGVTGCLSASGGDGNVVLPPQEDQLGESEDLSYPAYGQRFPEFTLANPLTDGTAVSVDPERVTLATAIYASCPAECLVLGNQLAGVQHSVNDEGHSDSVRFLAVTFDPERDTAPVLRDYADRMGVDLDAGNWQFGRPENPEEAESVVTGELGIGFEREGGEFTHVVLTFLVNPDGYVERAYRGERPEIERLVKDTRTVAEEYDV